MFDLVELLVLLGLYLVLEFGLLLVLFVEFPKELLRVLLFIVLLEPLLLLLLVPLFTVLLPVAPFLPVLLEL